MTTSHNGTITVVTVHYCIVCNGGSTTIVEDLKSQAPDAEGAMLEAFNRVVSLEAIVCGKIPRQSIEILKFREQQQFVPIENWDNAAPMAAD